MATRQNGFIQRISQWHEEYTTLLGGHQEVPTGGWVVSRR